MSQTKAQNIPLKKHLMSSRNFASLKNRKERDYIPIPEFNLSNFDSLSTSTGFFLKKFIFFFLKNLSFFF